MYYIFVKFCLICILAFVTISQILLLLLMLLFSDHLHICLILFELFPYFTIRLNSLLSLQFFSYLIDVCRVLNKIGEKWYSCLIYFWLLCRFAHARQQRVNWYTDPILSLLVRVTLCLWTAENKGPIVLPQTRYEYGVLVEWCWQGKIEELGEKTFPLPLCPQQIPRGLNWERTRASAMGGRQLTLWAMARPQKDLRHYMLICGELRWNTFGWKWWDTVTC
jgi:hypothetical protein